MTKQLEILAAAIKRHGVERTQSAEGYHYKNADAAEGARQCAEAIANTFARFADVGKDEFMIACGFED